MGGAPALAIDEGRPGRSSPEVSEERSACGMGLSPRATACLPAGRDPYIYKVFRVEVIDC